MNIQFFLKIHDREGKVSAGEMKIGIQKSIFNSLMVFFFWFHRHVSLVVSEKKLKKKLTTWEVEVRNSQINF